MLQQSDLEKLDRYRKDLCDQEEVRYIHSLFSGEEENSGLKYHIQSQWNEYLESDPESRELTFMLDHIHHIIHINESRKKSALIRKIYRWYSVAAAVLIIPVMIASGFWLLHRDKSQKLPVENPVTSTLFAPMGSRIAFTLPDGTNGWLNSGSSLGYSLPFSNQRQVNLLGEAWFDVVRDDANPFIITSGNSRIKVLGTKFNVNAYPAENYVEVALDEGKVEFSIPGISSPVVMKPDEKLVYRNGGVELSVTDASKYAAWVEGKLVFRGDLMAEVARRIERWYNVKVEVVDRELDGYVFRGTFQDDTLEEVLRLLSLTSPIRCRIVDRKMLDNGIFEKEKVMLYYKKSK